MARESSRKSNLKRRYVQTTFSWFFYCNSCHFSCPFLAFWIGNGIRVLKRSPFHSILVPILVPILVWILVPFLVPFFWPWESDPCYSWLLFLSTHSISKLCRRWRFITSTKLCVACMGVWLGLLTKPQSFVLSIPLAEWLWTAEGKENWRYHIFQ